MMALKMLLVRAELTAIYFVLGVVKVLADEYFSLP
jgi:hypothetical protein